MTFLFLLLAAICFALAAVGVGLPRVNLIGLGLGPTVVGIISDIMANGVGLGSAQGVRWALIVSAASGLVAFACFWLARKTIREDTVS